MSSKFSQTAIDSNFKLINQETRERSKLTDAQRVAQLIAQDVKEILDAKQKQVRTQQ